MSVAKVESKRGIRNDDPLSSLSNLVALTAPAAARQFGQLVQVVDGEPISLATREAEQVQHELAHGARPFHQDTSRLNRLRSVA